MAAIRGTVLIPQGASPPMEYRKRSPSLDGLRLRKTSLHLKTRGRRSLQCRAVSTETQGPAANPEDKTKILVGTGDNSVEVCRVVNGMWQASSAAWGQVSRDQALASMVRHFDAGLTTFDMADIYGPAEQLYGSMMDFLRRERGEEEATKVEGLTKFVPTPQRMTRAIVQESVDRSRRAMQVNQLDMVQFHWWDYSNPGYLDALKHLTDLKEEGKIKSVSLTNFDTEHLQIALENGIPIASNQVQHSLIDMRPQKRMAELCDITGVKLITYGTVLGGLLSEKFLNEREPNTMMGPRLTTPSQSKYKQMIDAWGSWSDFHQVLVECKTVADKHGASISNVGVRYVLDQPAVGASMVGVRFGIRDHIEDSKRLFDLTLDEEDRERLAAVLSKGKDLYAVIGDCGSEYRR